MLSQDEVLSEDIYVPHISTMIHPLRLCASIFTLRPYFVLLKTISLRLINQEVKSKHIFERCADRFHLVLEMLMSLDHGKVEPSPVWIINNLLASMVTSLPTIPTH